MRVVDGRRVALAPMTAGGPPAWAESLLERIRSAASDGEECFVVLDDDPTGSQTVGDVPILTSWKPDLLTELLRERQMFFILTNSRALPEEAAVSLANEVGTALMEAARRIGKVDQLRIASRSDSTLRGHFPAEVDALADALGHIDGYVLAPAFIDGGRVTVNDVHWILRNGELVPVGQTEYARDRTFAYTSSHLPAWVEERTGGATRKPVLSISLETIRTGGPEQVEQTLSMLRDRQVVVVNALEDRDLEVVARAVQEVERRGLRLLYRCGASFVRARAGLERRPLLRAEDLPGTPTRDRGGLIVCGSHVPMSTQQVETALNAPDIVGIELPVAPLRYTDSDSSAIAAAVAQEADEVITAGRHVLVYTSRDVAAADGVDPLEVGRRVSACLVDVVRNVDGDPAFVLTKGGITSSDVATQALEMERAVVLGQILPGVSVWQAERGPAAGIPYAVFPGNVGGPDDLLRAIRILTRD